MGHNADMKARLLQGKERLEDFEVVAKGETVTFQLRPLTAPEVAICESIKQRGVKAKTKMSQAPQIGQTKIPPKLGDMDIEMDMEKATENQWNARFRCVAFSMSHSGDSFGAKDIKEMGLTPKALVAMERFIYNMSEAKVDELQLFRTDPGGEGAEDTPNDGDPAD